MNPQPLSKLSASEIQHLKEQQIEQERMQDVLLVLDQLFRRERVTAKLVLDCLYDVGYVNLINQKVRPRQLQQLTKGVARLSKPLCLQVALVWFLNTCPKLITDWLHSLVVFDDTKQSAEETAAVTTIEIDQVNQEVQRLKAQARLSAGVAIAAVVALIGTVFYTSSRLQVMPWQLLEPSEVRVPVTYTQGDLCP
jgi:hypothetical protein